MTSNDSTMSQSTMANSMDMVHRMNKKQNSSQQNMTMVNNLKASSDMKANQFMNDISIFESFSQQLTGGMMFQSLSAKDQGQKINAISAKRRMLRNQEIILSDQLKQLSFANQKLYKDELRSGTRNNDANQSIQKQLDDIDNYSSELNQQRVNLLYDFDEIKAEKSYLKQRGLNILGRPNSDSDETKFYRDKINQDTLKLRDRKAQFASDYNEIIPQDNTYKRDEETFLQKASYYYEGQKLQGDDSQKLQIMTNLRKQIEKYLVHKGLEGSIIEMPFQEDHKKQSIMTEQQQAVQQGEYNSTLFDIMELRNQYIQSGGTDPQLVLQLNNLESYYKFNHPLKDIDKADAIDSFEDSYKLNMSNINMKERGKITTHPIFKFLPETFQKEVLQMETKQNVKQQNSIVPTKYDSLYEIKTIDTREQMNADESKLEYLRQAEFDIISSLTSGDYNREQKLKNFQQISQLKADTEKNLLNARVQQSLADAQKTNNRATLQKKESYLQYIRGNLKNIPIEYEINEGFILRLDFVNHLSIIFSDIKIRFGVFVANSQEPKLSQETNRHEITQDKLRECRCLVLERFQERDHEADKETYLFLEVWGYSDQLAGNWLPIQVGWTVVQLFDGDNKLLMGCFQLPLYSIELKPTISVANLPEVYNVKIGLRIALPHEPMFDSDNKVLVENDYLIPDLHVKVESLVTIHRIPTQRPKFTVFPIELQQINMNDSRLRQSQLPPNQFTLKFTLLSEAEQIQLTELADYEKTQASRPRLRMRLKTMAADKNKPVDGQPAQRPKLADIIKKVIPPPSSKQTPKNLTPSGSAAPKSMTNMNTQNDLDEENLLVFRFLGIRGIETAIHLNLSIKLAIFVQNRIVEDINKKPVILTIDLQSIDSSPTYFKFELTHTFNLIIQDLYANYSDEELAATYLFMAFFKDFKKLFGWQAIHLFEKGENGFKVRIGLYTDNMLQPPGQSPPFDPSKMKRSNSRIFFVIMQDNDNETNLPEFDNYVKEQVSKVQSLKKIPIVLENPKWITQIRVDLTKLKKFESKDKISVRIAILKGNTVVPDVIKRACLKQENLDVFDGQLKGEFALNHTIIFKLGFRYLFDTFDTGVKNLVMFFTFFSDKNLVGVVQFPMFNDKMKVLNTGFHQLPLYNLDKNGNQGDRTNKQIEINIREEPIRLDDIGDTPKQFDLDMQQEEDDEQDKGVIIKKAKDSDKNKRLRVILEGLSEYKLEAPIKFRVFICLHDQVVTDVDSNLCDQSSRESYPPIQGEGIINLQNESIFNLPINTLMSTQDDQKQYMLVLEFAQAGTNEPIGWYACNLLVKGQLNSERYNVQLLKGDCDKLPINFKNARKGLVKAQFRMLYDEKAESADKEELTPSRALQNMAQSRIGSQTNLGSRKRAQVVDANQSVFDIILFNVTGFTGKIQCYLKLALMQEDKFLKDSQGSPMAFTTDKVDNINQLLNFDQAKFSVTINQEIMSSAQKDQTIMLVYILGQNDETIGWYYRCFFLNGEKVHRGKWVENIYQKPFQRPPIDVKSLEKLPITIQFEVR